MGRLSKRTIQCRAARKQRDLQTSAKQDQQQHSSGSDRSSGSRVSLRCSSASSTGVNISQLGKPSLRRYQASYGLEPTLSDQDLLLSVQHHFDNCEWLDERSVLLSFAQAWRRDASTAVAVDSSPQ